MNGFRQNGSAAGAWLALGLCLLAAAPSLWIGLDKGDAVLPGEARALAIGIASWEAADAGDWGEALTPDFRGRPARDAWPGLTWLQMSCFAVADLVGGGDTVAERIGQARAGAAMIALLAICGVFWAGYALGGTVPGVLGALILASQPCFAWAGRQVLAPVAGAAWVTLGIAAAVWALRPLRPAAPRARQAAGWGLVGLFAALGVLTAGPIMAFYLILPVAAVIGLCRDRWGHALGLLAALILASLLVLPWGIWVYRQEASSLETLLRAPHALWAGRFPDAEEALFRRPLWLLAAAAPWSHWIVAALLQPISSSSTGVRVRMFLGGTWFLIGAALLLVMPVPRWPLLVVTLPAGAVLVAQLFRRFGDLTDAGRAPRLWKLLRWPNLALGLVLSVSGPLLVWAQPLLVRDGWLEAPLVRAPGWLPAALGAAGLSVIALISFYHALRDRPRSAAIGWAAWTLAGCGLIAGPMARGPVSRSPLREAGATIAEVADQRPVYWLARDRQPPPGLLLYSRRPLPTIAPAELTAAGREEGSFLVLTTAASAEPPGSTPAPGLAWQRHVAGAGVHIWRYE